MWRFFSSSKKRVAVGNTNCKPGIYKSQKYNHNANTCIVGRESSASFDSGYGVIFGFTVHLPQ